MFDPKYWKHCSNITVQQFCDFLLENFPHNAKVEICGEDDIYTHLEEDGSILSIDDTSLSDLNEYQDAELEEVKFE